MGMLYRRGRTARIEPYGSGFHLGIRISHVAQHLRLYALYKLSYHAKGYFQIFFLQIS
jgi:hypothetical protein